MALRYKTEKTRALLPAGMFPATLDSIELRDGPHGNFLLWTFRATENGTEALVSVPTSTKLSGGSKPRKFADILLGRPLGDDEEIDLSELCGSQCVVVITVKQLDGGATVNRIETVLPLTESDMNGDTPF
jgi:hypothetical protein